MMNKIRKVVYVTTALLAVIAISSIMGINAPTTVAQNLHRYDITYYVSLPTSDIVMKPGDVKIIPVTIFSQQDVPLNVKAGITLHGSEHSFVSTGMNKLPNGISATLDKNVFDLSPTTLKGYAPRDTTNLTIVASQNVQPGKYSVSVGLFKDNGESNFRIITLEIQ